MDFKVLGPLEVFDGDAVVGLGGPKKRAVLAVLLVHANSVVSAGRLIDEVWGEEAPKSARRTLHSYIANLRRSLNVHGEILRGRQGGYVLEVDASSIDALRFEHNVEVARSLWETDSVGALGLLEETLVMWRGPPFGLQAGDVPSLQTESTRLEELRLAAVELRIDCELAAGRRGPGIGELERLVVEHPFREGLWRRLMMALYRSGRQGDALSAYQRARRVLGEELGIEPSRNLRQLEEQILLQDPVLDARSIETHAPTAQLVPEYDEDQPPAFLSEDSIALEPVRGVFVGRDSELARLDRFLDDVLGGSGRPVFVTGEAGTGKTALVTEFAERAQAGHPELVVVGGTCEALTGIGDPYLPFRETLSLLTGDCERSWATGVISRDHALRLWGLLPTAVEAICDTGATLLDSFVSGRELASRVRAFGADGEHASVRLERLLAARAAGGSPPPLEQNRTFAEYAAVLEAVAAHGPLVVIVDDLHWADPSSVLLFAYLSRRLDGRRILLIGTYRPEDVAQSRGSDPHPLAEVITDIKHRLGDTAVDLDQAGADGGRSFVDALVDSEPNELGESFRGQLAERSGGRALFAVELLRDVQRRGDLKKDAEGRWVESGQISWQTLPARVEGVIERLFARLDSELRDALVVASVEGVEFTAELVASVRDIDEATLVRRLSQEVGHQHRLVEARGAHRTETQRLSRYRFRHSLFQKFLYDGLDPVERAYLHEAVGNALETLRRPYTGDVAVQLASHFQKAGLVDKAGLYLHQAGDRSMQLSANTEAIGYYHQALQIIETQPDTTERARRELTVLINLSRPLVMTQGYWAEEIHHVLTRARVLCEDLGATSELFPTLRGLWHYHHSRLEFDEAGELADKLLGLADDAGDPVLVTQAHWMLGENAYFRGHFIQARDHLEQAIDAYDPVAYRSYQYPHAVDPGVLSSVYAALTQWVLGYPDRASKDMADALALARKEPRSFTLGVALGIAEGLPSDSRKLELRAKLTKERTEVASEADYGPVLGAGRFQRGMALVARGQLGEGMRLLREGLKTYRGAFVPANLGWLAETQLEASQADEGLAVVAEALAMVDRAGGYFKEAELWRLKGELDLLARKDASEANNCFRTAIDTARRQGAKSWELRAVMSLARLLQRQGRDREAFEMLNETHGWFAEGFETGDLMEAKTLLDQLSAAS
jgi:DNA-binding SARP family transcriptional activator/tetratricopeptide (TPR) repeat protein